MSYVRARLDHAVANTAWRYKFPLIRVINCDPRHSGHRPIIVDVGERELRRWEGPMEVLKKFEARWLEEADCETLVEEAWGLAMLVGGANVMALQGAVLRDLSTWDREVLGALEKRIKNAKRELERCRKRCISQEFVSKEHILRYKLQRLENQLHVYWQQRAHNTWLLKGDRNTKFFHAFASERKQRNLVKRLKDDGGGVVQGSGLKGFIAGHYQNLFMSCAGGIWMRSQTVCNCGFHRR